MPNNCTPSFTSFITSSFIVVVVLYTPEHLRLLGAEAWSIGLFGSVTLSLLLMVPAILTRLYIVTGGRVWLPGLLVSIGLILWLTAAYLGDVSLIIEVQSWVWILISLLLLRRWHGEKRCKSPTSSQRMDTFGAHAMIRYQAAFLISVGIAAVLFIIVPNFIKGYQILLVLTTIMVAVLKSRVTHDASKYEFDTLNSKRNHCSSLPDTFTMLRNLPPSLRSLLIADLLLSFSVGMVAFFVSIVIVHHHQLNTTILSIDLQSGTTFALLLGIQTVMALMGIFPSMWLANQVGSRVVVGTAFFIVAVFPLLLIGGEFGGTITLFAGVGWFLATIPVQTSLLAERTRRHHVFDTYSIVRRAAIISAPFVAGLLYGNGPELMLGFSSCVGLLGYWEFLRFVRRSRT